MTKKQLIVLLLLVLIIGLGVGGFLGRHSRGLEVARLQKDLGMWKTEAGFWEGAFADYVRMSAKGADFDADAAKVLALRFRDRGFPSPFRLAETQVRWILSRSR